MNKVNRYVFLVCDKMNNWTFLCNKTQNFLCRRHWSEQLSVSLYQDLIPWRMPSKIRIVWTLDIFCDIQSFFVLVSRLKTRLKWSKNLLKFTLSLRTPKLRIPGPVRDKFPLFQKVVKSLLIHLTSIKRFINELFNLSKLNVATRPVTTRQWKRNLSLCNNWFCILNKKSSTAWWRHITELFYLMKVRRQ